PSSTNRGMLQPTFVSSSKQKNKLTMETKTAAKTKWSLDPSHSEVGFKVRHMMITNVSGAFKKFDAEVETEGNDFSTAVIKFTADTDSITTYNADRDTHLKSGDFFDVSKYPQIKFESARLEKKSEESYKLHGNLTIGAVTKPIVFEVEFGGVGK